MTSPPSGEDLSDRPNSPSAGICPELLRPSGLRLPAQYRAGPQRAQGLRPTTAGRPGTQREAVLAEGVERGRRRAGQANVATEAPRLLGLQLPTHLRGLGAQQSRLEGGQCRGPSCGPGSEKTKHRGTPGAFPTSEPPTPPPGRAVGALSGWAQSRAGLGRPGRAPPFKTRQRGRHPSGFQPINPPGGPGKADFCYRLEALSQ